MNDAQKPVHHCGALIEKLMPNRRVALSRKTCRRRVKNAGDRCYLHGGVRP